MNIVLLLIATVLLMAFTGWGAYRLCVRSEDTYPAGTTLVFGYSLGIVLFFPLYFLVGNAYTTAYGILFLALLINVLVSVRQWRMRALSLPDFDSVKKHGVEYALFIGVMLIAAIPYLSSGLGNYWHSGNEDVFDALNGRNAYLKNELPDNASSLDVSTRARDSLGTSLKERMGVTPKIDASFFRNRYAHEIGFLQYSSLAFFSSLLNLPKGMDVFVIQALLNLGFFALGVYAFVRHVFLQKKYIAALAAVISTLGNFYLTTYLNGHEGSLMYNAAIPFILYFFVIGVRDRLSIGRWLIVPLVMMMMVLSAYPFPLPYVVAPVVAYAALSWWADRKGLNSIVEILTDRRFQIIIAIILLAGFVISYLLGGSIRLRALTQYRAWGTAINHIGFIQFWGLWPSGIATSETNLAVLDSQPSMKITSLIIATALSGLSLFGFYRLMRQGITFVGVWVPLWFFFFFVMKFAVYDCYYFYKFLYINAWIVISATVVAIVYLIEKKRGIQWIVGVTAMLAWLVPNSIHNISALQGFAHLSFNEHTSSYNKILEAPRSLLTETFIGIPQYAPSDLVRQILGDADIATKRSKAEAQFILNQKGIEDIYTEKNAEVIWESDVYSINRKPDRDIVELATYWQPEEISSGKLFRWVSDGRIGNVLVDVQQRTQNSNFMYICGESGPGIEFRPIDIKVFDAKRKLAGTMLLGSYGCHWINISSFQSPFSLEHTEQGKIVSYVDTRKLVYRIMHIGFASNNSADQLPQELQLMEDIYTVLDRQAESHVSLGQNWYPFEKFGGESFRWVNDGAGVLLKEIHAKGTLVVEAELGPSASHTINLRIADLDGKELGICKIEGRKVCDFPMQFDRAGNYYLKITSDAAGQRIANDPRILNFRIFSLEWKE